MFAIKMKPFMGISEGTEVISEYEPPHRVVLKGRMGRMAPTTILTIEPEGQGSRLTRRVEMKPPGMPVHEGGFTRTYVEGARHSKSRWPGRSERGGETNGDQVNR